MRNNKIYNSKKIKKNTGHDQFFRAKKFLGQNFLKSEMVLNKICTVSNLKKDDYVLEIGPGKGALTKKLLEKGVRVVAVEKDRELIGLLKTKFESEIKNKKLILVDGDILELPITNYQFLKNYKIVANIPYNITGAILKKFLIEKNQPMEMILLVQKEVAERIVGKNPSTPLRVKESILSLSVKAYGTPKYIMKVSKKLFSPVPKVDSAIIYISLISRKNFINDNHEKNFFDLVKTGFAFKRKKLLKNLEQINKKNKLNSKKNMSRDTNIIENIFDELNINKNIRAEDLSFDLWLKISLLYTKRLVF
jgi:16S rRNA (adenine1518-N6/adenine1519-N6)-dimethyltransferase